MLSKYLIIEATREREIKGDSAIESRSLAFASVLRFINNKYIIYKCLYICMFVHAHHRIDNAHVQTGGVVLCAYRFTINAPAASLLTSERERAQRPTTTPLRSPDVCVYFVCLTRGRASAFAWMPSPLRAVLCCAVQTARFCHL